MSEKLDGIRAYWNGEELLSRKGKTLYPPKGFIKDFPPFELDGELWSKRGDFENIQSIVMDKIPSDKWKEIKYMLFEAPHVKGNFLQRLQKVQKYIDEKRLLHVKVIEQKKCKNTKNMQEFLQSVLDRGGEGLIVKDASREYFTGRSSSVLKVKKVYDMEAEVIGYKEGRGKFSGMMGSLHVRLKDGIDFFVGSGFSSEVRQNPPKIGSVVTFKYYGFTKKGKPKFASFMRVRKD